MIDCPRPDGDQLRKLKEAFADEALAESYLAAADQESGALSVSPSELFQVVQGRKPMDGRIHAALDDNSALRALHCRMIATASLFALGEARAASSGTIARAAPGCKIRLESSNAEGGQVYVILEFDAPDGNGASALVLVGPDDRVNVFDLPGVRRGVSQLIAEEGDALLELLSNPKTAVFIR